MKKVVKRIGCYLMLVVFLMACTIESVSADSIFSSSISPHGYKQSKAYAVKKKESLALSSSSAGKSYTLDRHNALIAAGWELKNVYVSTQMDSEAINTIMEEYGIKSIQNDVVIENVRIVTSHYEQPIKQKSKTNVNWLSGIVNFASPIISEIASKYPKAKWVPYAFGIISSAVLEASASSLTTMTTWGTIYFRDAEVKIEGWPNYFACASVEKYIGRCDIELYGYTESGELINEEGGGTKTSQAEHYSDDAYLIAKAMQYAKRDDGDIYVEYYPEVDNVTVSN